MILCIIIAYNYYSVEHMAGTPNTINVPKTSGPNVLNPASEPSPHSLLPSPTPSLATATTNATSTPGLALLAQTIGTHLTNLTNDKNFSTGVSGVTTSLHNSAQQYILDTINTAYVNETSYTAGSGQNNCPSNTTAAVAQGFDSIMVCKPNETMVGIHVSRKPNSSCVNTYPICKKVCK